MFSHAHICTNNKYVCNCLKVLGLFKGNKLNQYGSINACLHISVIVCVATWKCASYLVCI